MAWFDENGFDASGGGGDMPIDAGTGAGGGWTLPGAPIAQPAPVGTAAPGGDKQWLDWIGSTYGNSASRGGGFADLPAGQSLESIINRYNTETGANARYIGGPSGDLADFGSGTTDALTAGAGGQRQLWYDYNYGRPQGTSGGGGTGGGGGGGGATSGVTLPPAPGYNPFQAPGPYQPTSQVPGEFRPESSFGQPSPFSPTSSFGPPTPFQGTGPVPGAPTLAADRLQTPDALQYNALNPPPDFVAPDAETFKTDPGYAFRLQQQQQALENSAAARGISRTNNTWQALQEQAGNLASQEYEKVYGRRLGESLNRYQQNFQTNQANNAGTLAFGQANAQNALNFGQANNANALAFGNTNFQNALAAQQAGYGQAANTYGLNQAGQAQQFGQQAQQYGMNQAAQQQQYGQQSNTYAQNLARQAQEYGQGMGTYQQNYANAFNANQANNAGALGNWQAQTNATLGLGNLNLGYQQAANAYDLGQGNQSLGWGQLGLAQQTAANAQNNWLNNNQWQQWMDVAQLGNPGAPNSQQFGQTQGQGYTGIGNAQAAGQVGSANAWNQGLSNIGNQATQAGMYAAYYGQPGTQGWAGPTPGIQPPLGEKQTVNT